MKGTRIRDQLRRKVKHSAKPSTDTDDSEGSKAEIHYSDENISFKDITPFSPNPQQLRDNEQENWSDDQSSKVSDDVSDDEWEDEGFKGARRKLKGDGKSEKTTKKFLKENTLYDIAISDAVKDETMIESVENILKLFPDMFVKAYCRYVYEEQNEDTSKIVYKKWTKWHLCIVKYESNKCVICEKKMKPVSSKHLKEHEGPEGFNCVCGKTFKNLHQFQNHITKLHSGKCYCCPYCNLQFFTAEQIEQHIKTDHHQKHRYSCAVCKKGFDKELLFLEHINIHTGLRPHQCSECDKKYLSVNDLREHRKRHNKNVQFVCPLCGKQFVNQKLLKFHAVSHGEIRKYTCNICGKSFKTKPTLAEHQNYHSSEKCFSCTYCGVSFSTKNSLRKHLLETKNCPHYKNIVSSEAVKVMAKKAPAQKSKCASEKPFNCSDCDRSYIKKRGLTAHWKAKKHGPHTERVWSESDYENTARVENGEPGVSPTPEFTRSFNTLAQCNEVNMYDLDSLEVNKQPLLLDKCTVNDGMETDSSDEESAMYICL